MKNQNYQQSKEKIGYVSFHEATPDDYNRIGFKSGLEVHQQLNSKEKLFCRCPAGILHSNEDYHAEIIRHMRPTLSEMGVYDGTALMEFKTKKEITYKIHKSTACTYDIDDTPPFPINKEALEYALEICHLCKLNIVGEVHITRKQYLDGSIPAGFQRTAILGVNGQIDLGYKKVNLIQLSIEEDSCRETMDFGHNRVYKTDRLGVPLIETVTAPELYTPQELKDAAEHIRLLNRVSGRSRIGMGAGREDVNVSCKGGTRVEIKGVSRNKWIPKLSHNEAFRQWALLNIRETLNKRISKNIWKLSYTTLNSKEFPKIREIAKQNGLPCEEIIALNLPEFKDILSHFTQPGRDFCNEISDRLKVIACIEKPNIISSEDIHTLISPSLFKRIKEIIPSNENDAQIVIWGPKSDIQTAIETVEERCIMAFEGVPSETRRPLPNGITLFERVLPGADRMYPDTDSVPIPLAIDYIDSLKQQKENDIDYQMTKLIEWNAPKDTFTYILRNNLFDLVNRIISLGFASNFVTSVIGHRIKHIHGKYGYKKDFPFEKVYNIFKYVADNGLDAEIIKRVFSEAAKTGLDEPDSILNRLNFNKRNINFSEFLTKTNKVMESIPEYKDHKRAVNWAIGNIANEAVGNISITKLSTLLTSETTLS